ncbi:MAG: hypothetical protein M3P18_23535 [Actinomycetota bacterium]|nr:hypothetical protein [Actinomycetota bacterium]
MVACAALLIAAPAWGTTDPPAGLASGGRARWSFEALLHDTFGQRMVCVRGTSLNFVAGDCAPLATWEPYFYEFATTHHSAFRLSMKHFPRSYFGNYPEPIEVNGHLVACDHAETSFLVRFADAVGLSHGCVGRVP